MGNKTGGIITIQFVGRFGQSDPPYNRTKLEILQYFTNTPESNEVINHDYIFNIEDMKYIGGTILVYLYRELACVVALHFKSKNNISVFKISVPSFKSNKFNFKQNLSQKIH